MEVPGPFAASMASRPDLTETLLIANLALRTGKDLRWDAASMAAKGCPEAAPFIKRDYRTGW